MALIEVEVPRPTRRKVERLKWEAACFKCRKHWSVWLVSEVEQLKPGVPNVGITDFAKRRIDILATEPVAVIYKTLGHEMLHSMSGFSIQDEYRKLGEEHYIERAESVFWPTLAQFGAKMPELPDDFQAFVRRCRRGSK